MTNLLYFDTLRGRDSTGVAAIKPDFSCEVYKTTVPGDEFIHLPKYHHLLGLNDVCWIGHNRFKTVGEATRDNAHPFLVVDEDDDGLLVGAHNGTLKNKYVLPDHTLFGTDSEALYNHIANVGIEAAASIIDGAWALTWFDMTTSNLHVLRNEERTLFYAFEEGKKTMFWASEDWMLHAAMNRNNCKIDATGIRSFAKDTLYTIASPLKHTDEITLEKKEGVVGKPPAFFPGTTGGAVNWKERFHPKAPEKPSISERQGTSSKSGTETPSDGKNPQPKSLPSSLEPLDPSKRQKLTIKHFKGFEGVKLTKGEIEDLLANGCAWCEVEVITLQDRFAWLSDGKPVCEKCITGTHEKEVATSNVIHIPPAIKQKVKA
jgi:predicted glutamine amidotransferase